MEWLKNSWNFFVGSITIPLFFVAALVSGFVGYKGAKYLGLHKKVYKYVAGLVVAVFVAPWVYAYAVKVDTSTGMISDASNKGAGSVVTL